MAPVAVPDVEELSLEDGKDKKLDVLEGEDAGDDEDDGEGVEGAAGGAFLEASLKMELRS
jgi:hypothetical protein